ncbi:PREDICTED: uncharacterized protein LOC107334706 isoform X2 [Acropora digitifera]|uniref:uncharacterized protein LOC107334706 isoform X2 n=1 Tax=Acropora digitifera TaxID=70779 RepID=UPI00077B1680|nr:PREDICTED: uncharacterized protein LOC107334706 isoform X2 [Acropora digitifera]
MHRGKVSGFAIGIVVLLTFQQQGAVYGSVTVTPVVTSSSSSTTPANNSGPTATTSSLMPTLSAIAVAPAATGQRASTSGTSSETTSKTSSETPSTTGTPPSIGTTEKPTSTPASKETCASVTATLKEAKQKENVTEILRQFLVSKWSKYSDLDVTNLSVNDKKVSFTFCVKSEKDGNIESDTEHHLKQLLNATEVEINIQGVDITDLKAVEGECKKCSDGGGGPFYIKGKCNPKESSCNGVEGKMKSTDCSKYCSGVAFMASYLLVSLGIALSLSFYL